MGAGSAAIASAAADSDIMLAGAAAAEPESCSLSEAIVCGQTHSIRTVILEELVLQNLREIVSFASQRKDDFVKMVMDADMRQRNRGLAKRKKTLADAEKRIVELDTIFKRLYEDTISGKLSDERFQKLSTDYEKEQHQLQNVAATLRGEIEVEEQKSANVERFLSVVERYT